MSSNENISQRGAIVITGADNIEQARWVAVRAALRLEIVTGMKRSSRGTPTRILANNITGGAHATNRAAYAALDAFIVAELGMPARTSGLVKGECAPDSNV